MVSPGLDAAAAKLYAAIVRAPGQPLSAYADRQDDEALAELRASAITLQRLELIHLAGERLELTPPSASLERAVNAETKALEERECALNRLKKALSDYRAIHDPQAEFAQLAGDVTDLTHAIERLAEKTSGPVRMAHPDISVGAPSAHPLLLEQVRAGRPLRGLYDVESVRVRSLEISQWAAIGENQRLAVNIPTEFMCFGDEAVLLATDWGHSGRHAVLTDSAAVAAMVQLFDRIWAVSMGVHGSVETDSDRLVDLLEAGMSDDEIARTMGISQRSVRRRIDALMAECGVSTRFQLAMALTERGILPVEARQGDGV